MKTIYENLEYIEDNRCFSISAKGNTAKELLSSMVVAEYEADDASFVESYALEDAPHGVYCEAVEVVYEAIRWG